MCPSVQSMFLPIGRDKLLLLQSFLRRKELKRWFFRLLSLRIVMLCYQHLSVRFVQHWGSRLEPRPWARDKWENAFGKEKWEEMLQEMLQMLPVPFGVSGFTHPFRRWSSVVNVWSWERLKRPCSQHPQWQRQRSERSEKRRVPSDFFPKNWSRTRTPELPELTNTLVRTTFCLPSHCMPLPRVLRTCEVRKLKVR